MMSISLRWLFCSACLAAALGCGARVAQDTGGPEPGACVACPVTCDAGVGSACSASALDASSHPVDTGTSHDGGTSYPTGSTPPKSAQLTALPFDVIDAEGSSSLATLVMVSTVPTNGMHLFQWADGTSTDIPLPKVPTAVTLDATGKFAAVGFDGQISYIDLVAKTLLNTCAVSANVFDLALTSSGIAYVVPKVDQWVPIHVVDLMSCKETTQTQIRAASHAALHPGQSVLFTADGDLSPSSIERCVIHPSGGVSCNDAIASSDWGKHPFCGRLWVSPLGNSMYTGCGVVLSVPPDTTASPSVYAGQVGMSTEPIQFVWWAPDANRVLVQPGGTKDMPWNPPNPNSDTAIRIYDDKFLNLQAELQLPKMARPGGGQIFSRGKFVFSTPDAATIYAIVQADAPSSDFALAAITP